MRKYYLDNIRWATVLLVLFYHVCFMFNGVSIVGGVPGVKRISSFTFALYEGIPKYLCCGM